MPNKEWEEQKALLKLAIKRAEGRQARKDLVEYWMEREGDLFYGHPDDL